MPISVPEIPSAIPTVPLKYNKWRTHQREAVDWLVGALQRHPVAVLDSPCGSGKSLIGMAIAGLLGYNAVYVTGTRQLQTQVSGDFPDAVTIWGREHFPCLWHEELTAAECTHDADPLADPDDQCPFVDDCPYLRQKRAALMSPVAILSYAYFLTEANHVRAFSGGKKRRWPDRPTLVILDEGDTAPDELTRYVSIVITKRQLERCGLRPPKHVTDPDCWKEWAGPASIEVSKVATQMMWAIRKDRGNPDAGLVRLQRSYDQLAGKLRLFAGQADGNWLYELDQPDRWQFRPVWVSGFGQQLWGHADKVLAMSATMLNSSVWARDLGIDIRKVCFRGIPSTFPAKNRPFINIPVADFAHKSVTSGDMERMVQIIDGIMEDHPDEKGVIHAISYSTARYILANSRHPERIVSHDNGGERMACLKEHIESSRPTVLLSPSFTRGLDLPDDLATWQVLCLSEKTKAVTPTGLKSYAEINPGDRVFCLTESGQIAEDVVIATHLHDYNGEMVQVHNSRQGSVIMEMTPDHRVLLTQRHTGRLLYKPASELPSGYRIPATGKWQGRPEEAMSLEPFIEADDILSVKPWKFKQYLCRDYPFLKYDANSQTRRFRWNEITPTAYRELQEIGEVTWIGKKAHCVGALSIDSMSFMALAGWYLSEGSIARSRPNSIQISQNPGGLMDSITYLCDKGHLSYRIDGRRKVVITDGLIARALKHYCGQGSKQKFIHPDLLSLDQAHLKEMFKSMMAGDGHLATGGSRLYHTASESLATSFSELCLKIGFRPTISIDHGSGGYKDNIIYMIRVSQRRGYSVNPGKVARISYQGKVWCLTTSSGNFLASHNGRYFFTGNCRLPFLSLGDKQTARKRWTGGKGGDGERWYLLETVRNIVQAAGRIVRSPTDYGETIILDARWPRFYEENKQSFPAWFREAVV